MNTCGQPIVESLQGLQVLADNIDDPDRKIAFVQHRIRVTRISELLGSRLFVGAHSVLMRPPEVGFQDRVRFANRLSFLGGLHAVTYLYDQDIPVDSIALVFESPQIFSVTPDMQDRDMAHTSEIVQIDTADYEVFERSRLEVPVLAIDACDLLSA